MRPKIKLDHINDLHDARYCSAIGVYMLGFAMEPESDHYHSPAASLEIMEWLSGPIGVAEFRHSTADAINERIAEAGLTWVSIPLDYPETGQIQAHLLFRTEGRELNADTLLDIRKLAQAHPDALFEVQAPSASHQSWEMLSEIGLMDRCFLRMDDPDSIYALLKRQGQQPFGFSLGSFVEEPDGAIDYEQCDEFIEEFNSLVAAS